QASEGPDRQDPEARDHRSLHRGGEGGRGSCAMSFDNSRPGPFATHRAALKEGRFIVQRSRSSGEYCFPPRVVAPGTGADDLEWVEVSGKGEVHALTVIGRRPERGGDYNIAIVELDEGPRLMTRV